MANPAERRPSGVTRIDPHVKVLGDGVVRRAKRRGLDGLVFAPHFTRLPAIEAAARAATDDDLIVLPAREIFTGSWRDRRHVLAVGLSDPVPDFITLEGALAECAQQGASVLVPHPTFMTVSLSAAEIATHRDAIAAVEVYNSKLLPRHARRARTIADELDLVPFGSSYAHLPGTIGEVWTTFDAPIRSTAELQGALRDGAVTSVGRRGGWSHRRRRFLEGAHLIWENSWEKAERLLGGGMEPTHPRHPAYGGRFDDVAVY